MSNYFKYNPTGNEINSIFKGDWAISPTGYQTGFDIELNIPTTGYGILNPGSPPVFRIAQNDNEFLDLSNKLGCVSTSVIECIEQLTRLYPGILIVNGEYEDIVTNGLILLFDSTYIPSYPRNGNVGYSLSKYKSVSDLGLNLNFLNNNDLGLNLNFLNNNVSEVWNSATSVLPSGGFFLSRRGGSVGGSVNFKIPEINFQSLFNNWTIEFWFFARFYTDQLSMGFKPRNIHDKSFPLLQLYMDRGEFGWYSPRIQYEDNSKFGFFQNNQTYQVVLNAIGEVYINGARTDVRRSNGFEYANNTIIPSSSYNVINTEGVVFSMDSNDNDNQANNMLLNFKAYDRVISSSEVTQNWNAQLTKYSNI